MSSKQLRCRVQQLRSSTSCTTSTKDEGNLLKKLHKESQQTNKLKQIFYQLQKQASLAQSSPPKHKRHRTHRRRKKQKKHRSRSSSSSSEESKSFSGEESSNSSTD
ncbi:MAG: protein of unknown function DUF755 [Anelloviridae sp.]|nr:MAG: protein of unknown function DUF755 [Anelloviridae sp.]